MELALGQTDSDIKFHDFFILQLDIQTHKHRYKVKGGLWHESFV